MIKIRIGGWAGQGTVRAGTILGRSLSIEQGYHVVQQRSYSAAVRSGIAYSDVIADKKELDELVIDTPNYLLVMYQNTLDEWEDTAKKVDVLIVDSSRVENVPEIPGKIYEVPAGKIAEDIGTAKAANVVLLGSLARVSEKIDIDMLKKTVREEFPEKYTELNIEALEKGFEEVSDRE
ncbi:MAG: 2-oxoacid:acceptor oxidoreductase family protein [Candidatus Thermoplasmatota archaeon]|nr:2-oxoacid:acceptor oxidoreductase family protein [Candidatus Thermoplasmatota archaeon]MBS3790234.1 2-oxoacid:acceptor oxidoreductase family protein [Candidatus Thermoplasmatota archaeon]